MPINPKDYLKESIVYPVDYYDSTFRFIYNVEQYFCTDDLRIVSIQDAIFEHLTKLGFQIVLFYNTHKGIHYSSLDKISEKKYNQLTKISNEFTLDEIDGISETIEDSSSVQKGNNVIDELKLNALNAIISKESNLEIDENIKIAILFEDEIFNKLKSDESSDEFSSIFNNWKKANYIRKNTYMYILFDSNEEVSFFSFMRQKLNNYNYARNISSTFPKLIISDGDHQYHADILDKNLIMINEYPSEYEIKKSILRLKYKYNTTIDFLNLDIISTTLFRHIKSEKSPYKTLKSLMYKLENLTNINLESIIKEFKINMYTYDDEIRKIVGMDSIKKKMNDEKKRDRLNQNNDDSVELSRLYKKIGSKNEFQTGKKSHILLSGNPGTGKTSIARLIGLAYFESNILSSGHLIKISAGEFADKYIGAAGDKLRKAVDDARGGVLLIDDIGQLKSNHNSETTVTEVMGVLLRVLQDINDLLIIVAGYPQDIENFLKLDNGLSRRFKERYELPDYSADELALIFRHQCNDNGLNISTELNELLPDFYENWMSDLSMLDQDGWANASNAVELVFNIKKTLELEQRNTVNIEDLPENFGVKGVKYNLKKYARPSSSFGDDEFFQLENLTGLKRLKREIRTLYNVLKREENLNESENIYIFSGSSGTGKTTVARLMGKILKKIGRINNSIVYEAEMEYFKNSVTAQNEIDQANKGILFIDEAYKLADPMYEDGKLVLLKQYKKFEGIIILAGYESDMKIFLKSNEGLSSRSKIFKFDDFNAKELFEILYKNIKKNEFELSVDAHEELVEFVKSIYLNKTKFFGNAREMENLFGKLKGVFYNRHENSRELKKLILLEDIKKLKEVYFEDRELYE
jgi:replication-associated recombination protein RarA